MERTCIKCGIPQDIEQFLKEKTKDGRGHRCRTCIKKYQAEYQLKNKERLNEYSRNQYYSNRQPYLERSKRQRESNPEAVREYQTQYRKKNWERLNEYDLKRYHSDTRRKLRHLIGGGIRKKLNGKIKKSKSLEYIGCTWEFLIGYLESHFTKEMNWNNMGSVWHIDHKIPCRAFDFNDERQIKECFNYRNLQPLLALDNLKKLDRLPNGKLARYEDRLTIN